MKSSAFFAQANARPQSIWALPEELQQLARDGADDLIAEVIAIFQEDTASRLGVLRDAVRNGDCASIRAEAHALKGSSSQVGALVMARMCFQLEQVGASGNVTEAGGLLAEIQEHFAQVVQAMSVPSKPNRRLINLEPGMRVARRALRASGLRGLGY